MAAAVPDTRLRVLLQFPPTAAVRVHTHRAYYSSTTFFFSCVDFCVVLVFRVLLLTITLFVLYGLAIDVGQG